MEYLEIEKVVSKEKEPDMILVEGGSYFLDPVGSCNFKREVVDLYVSKYQITQEKWKKYMNYNFSKFQGEKNPIENVTWIETLKFCNKLSEEKGYQKAYRIEDNKLIKIIYKSGEEVYPDEAIFSEVEGYRLPTVVEWEWFARGGKVAIENRTFNAEYAGSDDIEEVAWCAYNSEYQTHTVGTKKPNALGLYDCTGNVDEWCYDTDSKGYISNDKPYIYDEV